jgi:hypothetical protein
MAPIAEAAPAAGFSPWMAFAAVAIAVVSFIGGRLSTQGQTPSGSGVPLATGTAPFAAGAAGEPSSSTAARYRPAVNDGARTGSGR